MLYRLYLVWARFEQKMFMYLRFFFTVLCYILSRSLNQIFFIIRSFTHSWLITGLTRLTRQVPLMEQKLPNQNNVSEWSVMSTRGLLFQWVITIQIKLTSWCSTKQTLPYYWKLTCSRHDIAEKLLRSRTKLDDKRDYFNFHLWTFHLYAATFQQHLHMEYISLSWYDIPELVVPIRISLIEWMRSSPGRVKP
jgi:hypothetical protein